MFKALAILFFIVISGLCAELVSAQTSSNYADDTNHPRPSEQIASPKAKAEAKRLYKEGVKYGTAGLYSQAAEILEKAVKLDPQYINAHYALGHAYFDLKQWNKAIDSLERALELNPKDKDAHELLTLSRTMSATLTPSKTETTVTEIKEASPTPNASIALTKIYRVGPGDVLEIRTNGVSPQSNVFTISPAGLLEHPALAEPLPASGLTVDEIGAKLEGERKRRVLIDNPRVSVGVREYASHTILVSGLVKDPGTKILRREAIPLYVVVADAQPLPDAGRVTVVRNESNETFEVDLAQTSEMNLLVRPGDVITLLRSVTQFVYVGGEVKLPGEKTYRRGLTLTQAIIAAGGVTPKSKEARLGRDDGKGFLVVTRYKLKDIDSGKVPDPVLKPGDRIMIQE